MKQLRILPLLFWFYHPKHDLLNVKLEERNETKRNETKRNERKRRM